MRNYDLRENVGHGLIPDIHSPIVQRALQNETLFAPCESFDNLLTNLVVQYRFQALLSSQDLQM